MHAKVGSKYAIIYLSIVILGIFLITNNYFSQKNRYTNKYVEKENLAYEIISDFHLETANAFFERVINKPEVLEIFKAAQSQDTTIRNMMRTKLYNTILDDYNNLLKKDVRQLQFHFTDCESFLRFHKPEKYGDNLKNIRYSVFKANSDLKTVYGFEEGAIYNGFRNVIPIIYKDEHLGSVEISMSYKSYTKKMEKLFKHSYIFIIRKEIVRNKLLKSELPNYEVSTLCDNFMIESDFLLNNFNENLFNKIHDRIHDTLLEGKSFVVEEKCENKHYLISFQSINNIKGEHVAYLINYQQDDTLHNYFISHVYLFIGFIILILIAYSLTLKNILQAQKQLKLQTQLIRSNKMASMGIYSAGLAHEINNPNNYIRYNAHMLLDTWKDVISLLPKEKDDVILGHSGFNIKKIEEIVPKLLGGINDGSNRIERIIGSLKDYSKVTKETSKSLATCHIKEILNTVIMLNNYSIQKKTDHLNIYIAENIPNSMWNKQEIEQVFINILQNALDSLPDRNCQVHIDSKYKAEDNVIITSIKDEGVGIKEENLANILDPFFTTKEPSGGTGLGLSITHSIVEEHKGSIEYISELNKGTTAIVSLPLTIK